MVILPDVGCLVRFGTEPHGTAAGTVPDWAWASNWLRRMSLPFAMLGFARQSFRMYFT